MSESVEVQVARVQGEVLGIKTLIESNNLLLLERVEGFIRLSKQEQNGRGERVGRLEALEEKHHDEVCELVTTEVGKVWKVIEKLRDAHPNGRRAKAKQVGLISLITAALQGGIYLWRG